MISLELVLLALDRVLSLTLACTHAGGSHSRVPYTGFFKLLKIFTVSEPEKKVPLSLSLLYSPKFLAQEKDGRKMAEIVGEMHLERLRLDPPPPIAGAYGQILACTTHHISSERLLKLKNSGIPICVVTGTNDHLVDPANSYDLKEILQPQEFIVFEGAGHGITLECKDLFNEAIVRNFKRASTKSTENETVVGDKE